MLKSENSNLAEVEIKITHLDYQLETSQPLQLILLAAANYHVGWFTFHGYAEAVTPTWINFVGFVVCSAHL